MKISVFCILFAVVCYEVVAKPLEPVMVDRKIQLCSSDLSDALALICLNTGYHSTYYQTHSVVSSEEVEVNALDVREKPRKQGIVDECCRQSCYLSQLEKYCNAE